MESIVSIIVPVYNAEKYLDRCVKSIAKQTYTNIEIILVDDGSPDNCPKMCDDFAKEDSRIKVIHKENAGAGEARNTGLDNATGEFVCFVDSDDYIEEDTIKKCMTLIKKDLTNTAVFGLTHFNDNGTLSPVNISVDKTYFDKAAIKNELIPSFFTTSFGFDIGVVCKIFYKKIIDDNSLRFMSEREIYSEDALFLLQYFSRCESASIVPENLYKCYENNASLSRAYKKEREEKLDDFLVKALKITQKEKLPNTASLHIMARYHGAAMVEYKRIVLSDLSYSEKTKILKSKYNNKLLQSTLKKEVFAVEKWTLRLFYGCVKLHLYFLSYLLLWLKAHN